MVESSGDATQAEVRRSLSVVGPDGVKYLILAAKRGVPFRAEALDGSAAGGSIVGSVVGWIIGSIVGAIAEIKAGDKTSWKLGVVRQRGFPQRIKQKESSCRRGRSDGEDGRDRGTHFGGHPAVNRTRWARSNAQHAARADGMPVVNFGLTRASCQPRVDACG